MDLKIFLKIESKTISLQIKSKDNGQAVGKWGEALLQQGFWILFGLKSINEICYNNLIGIYLGVICPTL
tara:strand:- start:2444 stop:2650 length:207 start_codon:yes stop_codon:yes gene_type:complete